MIRYKEQVQREIDELTRWLKDHDFDDAGYGDKHNHRIELMQELKVAPVAPKENELHKIFYDFRDGNISIKEAEERVDGIVDTAIGGYEEAMAARNWTERNQAYARNANRKVIRVNYYKIKNGDGDKI